MLEEEEERERAKKKRKDIFTSLFNILIKFYLKNMTFFLLKTKFLQFYLHKY